MNKLLLFKPLIALSLLYLFSPSWLVGKGQSANDIAFKSSEETNWARITLNAETNSAKSSTQISYNVNMSRGLDAGYDAGLLNSNPEFELYSRLVKDDDDVNFSEQCLPTEYIDLVIPLGLRAKAGDIITFTAVTLDFPIQYSILLEDRIMDTLTNLDENGGEYSIQLTEDSDGIGRFFLHTPLKATLGFGHLDLGTAYQIFTLPTENQLLIRGESKENTKARIYSITGKLVADIELKKELNNSIHFNENAGIYIVQISNEKRTFTKKFFWVK